MWLTRQSTQSRRRYNTNNKKKFLVNLLYSTPIEDSSGKAAAYLGNLVTKAQYNTIPKKQNVISTSSIELTEKQKNSSEYNTPWVWEKFVGS